ncbi:MAG: hypothetical protein EAX96_19935 [Candidatus Lokiarchaeota archaeon]|nr:hypothetical protein [Candidatus Lokiarchaeota archaeon]
MVSIASSNLIRERTLNFCKSIKDWKLKIDNSELFSKITEVLDKEYGIIPEKERIGKGILYISRFVSQGIFEYIKKLGLIDKEYITIFTQAIFDYGKEKDSLITKHFALVFLSDFILNFPQEMDSVIPLIEFWVNSDEWDVRETILICIINGLKKDGKNTLELVKKWAKDKNEKFRRGATESLRPRAELKWLRNPSKNDIILDILTDLNKDPSIYVRKSVGNNLKDLTKYMPEKILSLMEKWIKNSGIRVHDALASEEGLSEEEKRLIWTIKHAMRWIKNKNPEFYPRLEKILGKNYVLYFDEKKNRLANPKR